MKLRIKEICQMRSTTQKELADKLGVSEVTLSRASNGNTSLPLLENIASALHVPISDLFEKDSQVKSIICPHCQKTIPIQLDVKVKVE